MKTHLMTAPLLAGLILSAALPAFSGTTRTWLPTSGNWFLHSNWFPDGIPQSGDTVVINNGGTVNIDQPLNFAGTILWSQGTITSIPTGFTLATNGILEILSG
ncbi:MAG TPA: hypothetical protein VKA67_03700, partial [Verrucomicrobiae bacterium]|nr:hypothetical protein [Verrucomicrobiae bacterium]